MDYAFYTFVSCYGSAEILKSVKIWQLQTEWTAVLWPSVYVARTGCHCWVIVAVHCPLSCNYRLSLTASVPHISMHRILHCWAINTLSLCMGSTMHSWRQGLSDLLALFFSALVYIACTCQFHCPFDCALRNINIITALLLPSSTLSVTRHTL